MLSPADAKALKNGEGALVGGYVTAIFADYNCFVIESENGASAITVAPLAANLQIGCNVVVSGTLDNGILAMESVQPLDGTLVINPLLMSNREVAGAIGNPGHAAKDLLVSTTGVVLSGPALSQDGSLRFSISDSSVSQGGSTLADSQTLKTGIVVIIPPSVVVMRQINVGDNATVTGIVAEGSLTQGLPCAVIVRSAADVAALAAEPGNGASQPDDRPRNPIRR